MRQMHFRTFWECVRPRFNELVISREFRCLWVTFQIAGWGCIVLLRTLFKARWVVALDRFIKRLVHATGVDCAANFIQPVCASRPITHILLSDTLTSPWVREPVTTWRVFIHSLSTNSLVNTITFTRFYPIWAIPRPKWICQIEWVTRKINTPLSVHFDAHFQYKISTIITITWELGISAYWTLRIYPTLICHFSPREHEIGVATDISCVFVSEIQNFIHGHTI